MELLVFFAILCALAVLAARFGYDSRELGLHSAEDRQAHLGLSWGRVPKPRALPRPRLAHAVRHPIAAALYRMANWLAPEVSRAAG